MTCRACVLRQDGARALAPDTETRRGPTWSARAPARGFGDAAPRRGRTGAGESCPLSPRRSLAEPAGRGGGGREGEREGGGEGGGEGGRKGGGEGGRKGGEEGRGGRKRGREMRDGMINECMSLMNNSLAHLAGQFRVTHYVKIIPLMELPFIKIFQ